MSEHYLVAAVTSYTDGLNPPLRLSSAWMQGELSDDIEGAPPFNYRVTAGCGVGEGHLALTIEFADGRPSITEEVDVAALVRPWIASALRRVGALDPELALKVAADGRGLATVAYKAAGEHTQDAINALAEHLAAEAGLAVRGEITVDGHHGWVEELFLTERHDEATDEWRKALGVHWVRKLKSGKRSASIQSARTWTRGWV